MRGEKVRGFKLENLLPKREAEPGPIILDRHRIYLLPTGEGVACGFIVLALILGSANYNTSLGMILAFLIAGIALMGMIHTHRNLSGLSVTVYDAPPVFAGSPAHFKVSIENLEGPDRYSLTISGSGPRIVLDCPKGATNSTMTVDTAKRGILPLGRITLETGHPMRLFRAWSPLNFTAVAVVYPSPSSPRPLPEAGEAVSGEESGRQAKRGVEDFAGLRDYVPGDSLSRVHWKSSARSGTLSVKEFHGEGAGVLLFDFNSLKGMGEEARLRVLCRWILDAEKARLHYRLNLPGVSIPAGGGPAHKSRCLSALAGYGL
ncbi:DUF58 domain-containing protein [bacterium]|nr:MAG: DUF58 domain-containing protein [bacterium]